MKRLIAVLALVLAVSACGQRRTTIECDAPVANHFKCSVEQPS